MDRRTFLIQVGALGAVGAVAAACGSDKASVGTVAPTGDTTSPATAASVAETAAPTVAETAAPTVAATEPAPTLNELRIGLPGDTTNVDGDKATLGMQSPNANIYERLVHMTDDFEIEPWLAESWEFVEPNTWRFHLRKDVTFQDGSPLTASDVVWTLDRVGRAGGRNINAAEGATVAVDDHTVEFTPVKPNRKVPLQIVHPNYGIMKKGSDPINAPVGTGPFSFVSYKAKESFKVVRNGVYWNAAKAAQSSGITFFYLPDANARILALQSGDLDAITEVPRESVAQVAAAGFVVEKLAKVRVRLGPQLVDEDKARRALIDGLTSASGMLRRELGRKLSLRYAPKLVFYYDEAPEKRTRIDELLHEIAQAPRAKDDDEKR